jgi:hypothetical protein
MAPKSNTSKVKSREELLMAFISHVVSKGDFPDNFFHVAKEAGVSERDYYVQFPSVAAADKAVWELCHQQTVATLAEGEAYANYSAREKVLAYYFSWIEYLLGVRSYLMVSNRKKEWKPASLSQPEWVKQQKEFFTEIINGGISSGEIASRKFLDDKYKEAIPMLTLFIFKTWIKDETAGFQTTDQAIEKSVNLMFDLLAKGTFDSMIDFGKFIFTQKPI